MSIKNSVTLVGRLTKDPYISKSNPDNPVAFFRIAVQDTKSKPNGDKYVNFFDVKAWGKLALICEKLLVKGRLVMINGSLRMNNLEVVEKESGKKVDNIDIVVNQLEVLDNKNSRSHTSASNETNTESNVSDKTFEAASFEEAIDML